LRIHQRFEHLTYLEDTLIHHSRLVLQRSVQSDDFLFWVEKLGLGWRVGKKDEKKNPPRTSHRAKDDKEESPGREAGVDLSDAVGEETGDGVRYPIAYEPEAHPRGLLFPFVKHPSEQRKSGGDGRFRDAEEETCNHQSGVVFSRPMCHEDDTPYRYCDGEVLAEWVFDGEIGAWPTPEEVAEIKY
jgi:hypothetical protein